MVSYERSYSLTEAFQTFEMLQSLDELYPGFRFWFLNKVIPGILVGRDVLITAKEHGRIIGVALGKISEEETKIRCMRVLPEYQKRGVGIHLGDRILTALNCDTPIVTVPQELFHDFGRMFVNRFGFNLTEVLKGPYRPGMLEYVFNGMMAEETAL